MTTATQMVDTRLGRLHVEVDGNGLPAVMWHSLFVDSTTWARLRLLLCPKRRLILVDGPGAWPKFHSVSGIRVRRVPQCGDGRAGCAGPSIGWATRGADTSGRFWGRERRSGCAPWKPHRRADLQAHRRNGGNSGTTATTCYVCPQPSTR
jgi:hypothetical protein